MVVGWRRIGFPRRDPHPLWTVDARKKELVQLRYFAGFTFKEAAKILGIFVPASKQRWAYARAWLRVELGRSFAVNGS